MNELIGVLSTLVAEADAGRPAALCVVVKTQGSTPQAAGAAMLLRADLKTVGTLGGGCVEAEVHKRAAALLHERQSALLSYKLDHDYGWDDGLICGGRMFVAVIPFTDIAAIAPLRSALALAGQSKPASVPLEVAHEGQILQYRLHLEVSPTLLIAGAGHVGQALAELSAKLDFHTIVIDDRADFASPARFPPGTTLVVQEIEDALRDYPLDRGTFVVIVTRGHRHDFKALDAVVRRPAGYIGLIGSKRKSLAMLEDLAEAGVPADVLARVHTPIGLSIGAITVPEIAVSIAAELIQVRRHNCMQLVEGPLAQTVGAETK